MVRRRTRPAKGVAVTNGELLSATNVTVGVANGALLEDHYFASPKRKDCKIDNNSVVVDATTAMASVSDKDPKMCGKQKVSNVNAKTKNERGGIAGRTIGVPLATRSQTRTIESYLKAKTAAKNAKLQESDEKKASIASTLAITTDPLLANSKEGCRKLSLSAIESDVIFDLSEDTNDTDNTELSDEVCSGGAVIACTGVVDFATHRSSMRDSYSSRSSTTDNIFLQEPVLTLNVDKSPNQAYSIKINKTLEIEPVFSSPPSLTATALNGRFNQIVSLDSGVGGSRCHNNGESYRESFVFEPKTTTMLPDNDNSSCDSGVAFVNSLENSNSLLHVSPAAAGAAAGQTRRRKPATPHRIVCPSPIKSAPHIVSPVGFAGCLSASGRKISAAKEQLSPRKSQRHFAATAAAGATRRRLNQQKEQTPYPATATQNGFKQNNYIKDCDDDYDHITPDVSADGRANNEFKHLQHDFGTNDCRTSPANLIFSTTMQQNFQSHENSTNNSSNNILSHTSKMQGDRMNTQEQQKPKIKQHNAPQPLASTNGNRELTEFFTVRRSVRKTKTAVKEEMMRNLEQAILEERAEGLKIAHFDGKGRGIIADRRFQRGEFVVEYVGDLISMTEAAEREKRYALDENAGCYMYYFKHKNQQYCIDATIDTGKLGRLVNHSRTGNLITKVVVVKQRPHLILIAREDIEEGEELTYDYGDRSKESLLHHPWLAF